MSLPTGFAVKRASTARLVRLVALATEAGERRENILFLAEHLANRLMAGSDSDTSERLSALRTMPYGEYLRTDEWRDVRHFALERAQRRCLVCPAVDGLQVHHRSYNRRGAERLADVTVLCDEHHAMYHGLRAAA